jgi:hypothetical protein
MHTHPFCICSEEVQVAAIGSGVAFTVLLGICALLLYILCKWHRQRRRQPQSTTDTMEMGVGCTPPGSQPPNLPPDNTNLIGERPEAFAPPLPTEEDNQNDVQNPQPNMLPLYVDQPQQIVNQHQQPINQQQQPINQQRQPIIHPQQVLNQPRQPVNQARQPVNQHQQPINQPLQTINQPQQVVNQPTQPVNQHRQPINQHQQPINQTPQTINQPRQPVNQPRQPVNQPRQTVNQPTQPINQHQQPINQPPQTINQPQQVVYQPRQPVNLPRQAVNQHRQVVNQPQQVVNQPRYPIDTDQTLLKYTITRNNGDFMSNDNRSITLSTNQQPHQRPTRGNQPPPPPPPPYAMSNRSHQQHREPTGFTLGGTNNHMNPQTAAADAALYRARQVINEQWFYSVNGAYSSPMLSSGNDTAIFVTNEEIPDSPTTVIYTPPPTLLTALEAAAAVLNQHEMPIPYHDYQSADESGTDDNQSIYSLDKLSHHGSSSTWSIYSSTSLNHFDINDNEFN